MNFYNLFSQFDNGKLVLPQGTTNFSDIPWTQHPSFEGVALKHILTSKETNGEFSFHLVRIAPNKKIGNHLHEAQLETHEVIAGSGICIHDHTQISYEPGTVSILSKNVPHEVAAGENGLYLFAKFIPALN